MPDNVAAVVVIALVAGGLIGTIGVGGVVLSPLLALVAGVDLQQAMAAASASFFATGLAGTWSYALKGSIRWRIVGWLSVGLAPSAVFGARMNQLVGNAWLSLVLAVLIAISGVHTLLPHRAPTRSLDSLRPGPLILVGSVVGFGSALTGTGGPVLLIPILLPTGVPVLPLIGVSQAIQLPIGLFTTLTHGLVGKLDLALVLWVGAVQVLGVVAGAALAHRLNAGILRRLVAFALLGVAVLLSVRYI